MKILVTAFEPFGDKDLNSSWEVASQLPEMIDNCVIVKELLPVDFMIVGDKLRSLIEKTFSQCCGFARTNQQVCRIEH